MRYLPLLCIAVLFCIKGAHAQQRVKLADIVAAHEKEEKAKKQSSTGQLKTTAGKEQETEGEEYQFERWLWWAKQHTDKDGYVVPTSQAWDIVQKHYATSAAAKTTATQANWSHWGPDVNTNILFLSYQQADGEGRVNTIGFHPTDKNTFWVGTAAGGAWKTTNFGATWTCMTDNLPNVLPISDIDINPKNPNTIYLCTGDKDGSGTVGFDGYTGRLSNGFTGVGLLKSKNGGQTWDTTGFKFDPAVGVNANALVINRVDTNSLLMATTNGLYKSNNGGASWVNVTPYLLLPSGATVYNCWEVVYHPVDTNIVYASAWISYLNMHYAVIIRSADGGKTWSLQLDVAYSIRASIAVTPASPNLVKVLTHSTATGNEEGIYTSSDAGLSFTKLHNPADCSESLLGFLLQGHPANCQQRGQCRYNLSICIDPADTNHVLIGGVMSLEFHDGGNTNWNYLNWFIDFYKYLNIPMTNPYPLIHADKHFLGYHPLDTSYLMECNDGGIFYKRNGVWKDITPGIDIMQFYRNAVSKDGKFALGGAQDNGSHYVNNGITQCIGGGDGMECQVDLADSNIIYVSTYSGLSITRYDRRKAFVDSNFIDIREKIPADTGVWTTPFLLNPLNQNNIIAGYGKIYSSMDRGETWTTISKRFGQSIERLAMSPQAAGIIYAVEEYIIDNRGIHFTTNNGLVWEKNLCPYPEKNITDIKADAKNAYHFWVTFGGFGNTNKVAEYTEGVGWKSISQGLPPVPVYCIEADSSDGTLYAGTFDGVYYRPANSFTWLPYNTNMPHVPVADLGISYVSGQLVAATYGRGMWTSPKYVKDLGMQGVPYAYKQLDIYPNPARDRFTVVTAIPEFNNDNVTVQMTDMKGQVVSNTQQNFNGNKLEVNGANLPNGVYVIHITGKYGIDAKARVVITK